MGRLFNMMGTWAGGLWQLGRIRGYPICPQIRSLDKIGIAIPHDHLHSYKKATSVVSWFLERSLSQLKLFFLRRVLPCMRLVGRRVNLHTTSSLGRIFWRLDTSSSLICLMDSIRALATDASEQVLSATNVRAVCKPSVQALLQLSKEANILLNIPGSARTQGLKYCKEKYKICATLYISPRAMNQWPPVKPAELSV